MSTISEVEHHAFEKLELRTAYGPVYRDVSTAAPREANADEIPIIDISESHLLIQLDCSPEQMCLECQRLGSATFSFHSHGGLPRPITMNSSEDSAVYQEWLGSQVKWHTLLHR